MKKLAAKCLGRLILRIVVIAWQQKLPICTYQYKSHKSHKSHHRQSYQEHHHYYYDDDVVVVEVVVVVHIDVFPF